MGQNKKSYWVGKTTLGVQEIGAALHHSIADYHAKAVAKIYFAKKRLGKTLLIKDREMPPYCTDMHTLQASKYFIIFFCQKLI